jgi:hypothetical protein
MPRVDQVGEASARMPEFAFHVAHTVLPRGAALSRLLFFQDLDRIEASVGTARPHPDSSSVAATSAGSRRQRVLAALGDTWRSLSPVYSASRVAIALLLVVMGAGLLRFTGPSLDGALQVPKLAVVIVGTLFLAAVCSAALLGSKLTDVNRVLTEQRAESAALLNEIQRLKKGDCQIAPLAAYTLQIEGIPLQGLELMLQTPLPPLNPVMLEHYALSCRFVGSGPRLDANLLFTMKGRNLLDTPLAELCLPICGDNLVRLCDIQPQFYDMIRDPRREHVRVPRLVSSDGMRKDLALSFDYPGIGAHKDFSVEFHCTWAAVFNHHKDYWFIDNTFFQGDTELLLFELDLTAIQPVAVTAYSVRRNPPHEKTKLGNVPPSTGAVYRFSVDHPGKDMYYVLMVTAL